MTESKKLSSRAVSVIVVLAASVVLAMILLAIANYPTQWRHQVDEERLRHLEVLRQAFLYRMLDDGAVLPLPEEPMLISNTGACNVYCPALGRELPCYNASDVLVPGYVRNIPRDPLVESDRDSGYYLESGGGRFIVGACRAFYNGPIEIDAEFPVGP